MVETFMAFKAGAMPWHGRNSYDSGRSLDSTQRQGRYQYWKRKRYKEKENYRLSPESLQRIPPLNSNSQHVSLSRPPPENLVQGKFSFYL